MWYTVALMVALAAQDLVRVTRASQKTPEGTEVLRGNWRIALRGSDVTSRARLFTSEPIQSHWGTQDSPKVSLYNFDPCFFCLWTKSICRCCFRLVSKSVWLHRIYYPPNLTWSNIKMLGDVMCALKTGPSACIKTAHFRMLLTDIYRHSKLPWRDSRRKTNIWNKYSTFSSLV